MVVSVTIIMKVIMVVIMVVIVVMIVVMVVVVCRLLLTWFTDPDLVIRISASACITHNVCFYSTNMDLTCISFPLRILVFISLHAGH